MILERSNIIEAHFHVSVILKKALIREWSILPISLKAELSKFLIVSLSDSNLSEEVIKQLIHCFSMIQKRTWSEHGSAGSEFQKYTIQVLRSHLEVQDPSKRIKKNILGLRLFLSLITEFSISSTEIKMSWKIHEKSRVLFQNKLLMYGMKLCLNFLSTFTSSKSNDNDNNLRLVTLISKLLFEILTWDFNAYYDRFELYFIEKREPPTLEIVNDEWKSLIINPKLINLLLNVHKNYRSFSFVTKIIRQCIVQLCKVDEKCISVESMRLQYFSLCLKALLSLSSLALQNVKSKPKIAFAELYECCEGFFLLTLNFPIYWFRKLPNYKELLSTFVKITINVNNFSISNNNSDGGVNDDILIGGLSHLLNGWSYLIETSMENEKDEHFRKCCSILFNTFFKTKVSSSISNFESGEDYLVEEHLNALSNLGRMNIHSTFECLYMSFNQQINDFVKRIRNDFIWNNFAWIIDISTHLMVDVENFDNGDLTEEMMLYTKKMINGNMFVNFMSLFFKFCQIYLSSKQCDFNGIIAERIVWFFKNWIYTYLMCKYSGENENILLEKTFCGLAGEKIVEFLLKIIIKNIYYVKSRNLAIKSCELLKHLTTIDTVEDYLMEKSKLFKQLLENDKHSFFKLNYLSNNTMALLTKAICNCRLDSNNLKIILIPLYNQFSSILSSNSNNEETHTKINYCLEKLISVSSGVSIESYQYILQSYNEFGIFQNIIKLLDPYKNNEEIVVLITKFFSEVTTEFFFEEFFSFDLFQNLFMSCLKLIQQFIQIFQNKIFLKSSLNNNKKLENMIVDNVENLVQILSNISMKRFLEKPPPVYDPEKPNINLKKKLEYANGIRKLKIHEYVLKGIDFIVNFLKVEIMTQYVDLSRKFFSLLAFMFSDLFVKNTSLLPKGVLEKFLNATFIGLKSFETTVNSYCLEILSSVVVNYKLFLKKIKHYVLLTELFKIIIFEKISKRELAKYSKILLPLIILNINNYQLMISEIERNSTIKEINITEWFNKLMYGVTHQINPENLQKFQNNLFHFLNIRLFIKRK